MSEHEQDLSGNRNILIEGVEIFTDLEAGRLVAYEAMQQDRALYRDWLDQNFPYMYGPRRNDTDYFGDMGKTLLEVVARDAHPMREAWLNESLAKLLCMLDKDEKSTITQISATGGADWLDKEDFGFEYFGVIEKAPSLLSGDEMTSVINAHSQNITGDTVMQSFSGVIVRAGDIVGQFTGAGATCGFSIEPTRLSMSDALVVRAWRTA